MPNFGSLFGRSGGIPLGRPELSAQTDRNLAKYEKFSGITIESFKGKTILELGSGRFETFSKEAAKKGVTVVSLNPNLREEYAREVVRTGDPKRSPWAKLVDMVRLAKWQGKSVAGLAEAAI